MIRYLHVATWLIQRGGLLCPYIRCGLSFLVSREIRIL